MEKSHQSPAARFLYVLIAVLVLTFSSNYAAASPQARDISAVTTQAPLTSLAGVPNFGQVSPTLFRGGQPGEEGLKSLKNIGVSIIVNFRDDASESEQRIARELGIQYIVAPWVASHNPTSSMVSDFLNLLRTNPNQKIFVHCHAGSDRTGTMIAVYRMVVDNWTPAKAVQEMSAFHYHHFFFGNLQKYVEGFPTLMTTDAAIKAALVVAPVAAPAAAVTNNH